MKNEKEEFTMEEKKLGRRERKKIASRQAILAAAKQEFVRQGYKDASIADIMERADLGVGTFYNYFSSKEEILMNLLVGLMGEVTSFLDEMKAAGKPALARLTEGCQETARLLDENRFVLALFFAGSHAAPVHGKAQGSGKHGQESRLPYSHGPGFRELFLAIIEEGQASGELRADVPAPLIAEMLHAAFQSAAFSHLGLSFRENFEGKLQLLLDGIRA